MSSLRSNVIKEERGGRSLAEQEDLGSILALPNCISLFGYKAVGKKPTGLKLCSVSALRQKKYSP